MNKIKATLKWLAIILPASFLFLVAAVFVLPPPYAVNISLGDLIGGQTPEDEQINSRLTLPDGFKVNLYTEGLKNARVMRLTQSGDLLVSQPREGKVTLLGKDSNGDGKSDSRRTLIDKLHLPHGLALYKDWLYIAETDAIGRIGFNQSTGQTSGEYERIITDIPSAGMHWTRTIRFGPDGLLYLSIGSSCNVCVEEERLRSTISRYQPDGSGHEIIATGLRNAVDFDWNNAGQLFATDNGRDLLGDNFPPDELNEIHPGGFYGWPLAHGDNRPDPDYGKGKESEISRAVKPVHKFRPHNAPLGITFYRGEAIPALENTALVALHGSWNRSIKDGYEVVALRWQGGRIWETPLLTGFEQDGGVIGRPAFIEQGPNGEIFISDDYSGVVYRLTYNR
ncbi:MAG: PQQ-dependent sugar dehydrogenase [Endozoicomonas sp.]